MSWEEMEGWDTQFIFWTCLGSGFLSSWGSPLDKEMDVVKTPVVLTDARGREAGKEEGEDSP